MQFTPQVERWRPVVQKYWGSLTDVGLAIISQEAPSGDPNAHNTTGEDSRGLFQINVGPGARPGWANLNLFDPEVNARQAWEVWQTQGPTAWSTWGAVTRMFGQPSSWRPTSSPDDVVNVPGTGGQVQAPRDQVHPPQLPFTLPDPLAPLQDAKDSLQGVAEQIRGLTDSANTTVKNLFSTLEWFGQVNLWKRFALGGLGGVLLILGIILFAMSFTGVPKAMPVPIPV